MTNLRSRKVENLPKSGTEIEPITPVKKVEVMSSTPSLDKLDSGSVSGSVSSQGLRRSSRLSKSRSLEFVEITRLPKRRKSTVSYKNSENVEETVVDTDTQTKSSDSGSMELGNENEIGNRSVSLQSGKKVLKADTNLIDDDHNDDDNDNDNDNDKLFVIKNQNETEEKEEDVSLELDVKELGSENTTENTPYKLQHRKRLSLSKPDITHTVDDSMRSSVKIENENEGEIEGRSRVTRRFKSREGKKKEVLYVEGSVMDQMETESDGFEKVEKDVIDETVLMEVDLKEGKKLRSGKKLPKPGVSDIVKDSKLSANENKKDGETEGSSRASRRFSREDKKKGVLIYDEEMEIKIEDDVNGILKADRKGIRIEEKGKEKVVGADRTTVADVDAVAAVDANAVNMEQINRKKEMHKHLARENALRFAHFSLPTEPIEEDVEVDEDDLELPTEANDDVEDWPGPFSTAMKIIRDRAEKMASGPEFETSKKTKSVPLIWVPKEKKECDRVKKVAPSLQELCMEIMAEHVDAITSLESVPDVIRHKLSHMLCKSRKMNSHFLDLLASGSPYEIRVRDCSWLTEEQLTKTLENSDTSNLMVLQLDQIGRCLPDYVLYSTLTNVPNKLSALTNISLKGACRLSDAGLTTLVSNASALRSINLGCCSLLTCDGIISLADKLGPILKELYIDECFGIVDAKSILPALLKLQQLEVLSISHFETVNDSFILKFVTAQGQKMKELILADCPKLTDKALKAIAENCPDLCAIDLTNLGKLTDASLGHLANGCQSIQTLKLRRNAFSDEAVAAYLEACGRPLSELSLNHVVKVAHHTAISLAKHAKNLQHLDLSWCRELTDEALGLIVDSCLSLKIVKIFGCTQITDVFTNGHSNEVVKVVGLKETPILKNIEVPDFLPLRYSPV